MDYFKKSRRSVRTTRNLHFKFSGFITVFNVIKFEGNYANFQWNSNQLYIVSFGNVCNVPMFAMFSTINPSCQPLLEDLNGKVEGSREVEETLIPPPVVDKLGIVNMWVDGWEVVGVTRSHTLLYLKPHM